VLVGCIDLETTGVKVDTDRICEVALVIQDMDSGTERLAYVRRINPEMHIAAGASRVHGIMDADVMGCPTFKTAAPLLMKVIDRCDLIIGHNHISFDIPLLIHEMIRCGAMFTKSAELFDTMLEGRWATPDGKMPTLGELCWALDVDYDPALAHAAKYDVDKTLECFRRGIALGHFKMPERKEKS
jgi:DNA polymerase-3 subunit epsilon